MPITKLLPIKTIRTYLKNNKYCFKYQTMRITNLLIIKTIPTYLNSKLIHDDKYWSKKMFYSFYINKTMPLLGRDGSFLPPGRRGEISPGHALHLLLAAARLHTAAQQAARQVRRGDRCAEVIGAVGVW